MPVFHLMSQVVLPSLFGFGSSNRLLALLPGPNIGELFKSRSFNFPVTSSVPIGYLKQSPGSLNWSNWLSSCNRGLAFVRSPSTSLTHFCEVNLVPAVGWLLKEEEPLPILVDGDDVSRVGDTDCACGGGGGGGGVGGA